MAGIIAPFEKVVGESAQTTARITRIRFVSPDKTYAVVDAVTRKRMSFTMVGSLASFKVDDEVRVKGVWMASKYGTQLRVSSCEIVLPTSSVGLARFLSSQLTGIGLRMAERIIDHFGENTIDILDNNPDRLREVKGISQGKLESIRKEWAEQQQTRQIFVYLQGHGLSYDLSARLIGIYGKKIIAILKQQPYLLAREINGIGFKRADQIAPNGDSARFSDAHRGGNRLCALRSGELRRSLLFAVARFGRSCRIAFANRARIGRAPYCAAHRSAQYSSR